MNNSQKNKVYFAFIFLFIFCGILITNNVMAGNCNSDCSACTTKDFCESGPDCVWIKTRTEEYCRRALEVGWPSSPVGTHLTSKSQAVDIVKYLYEWGISLGGMAAFISLIMAGFQYLTSAGNEGKMREARDNINSSLLGLLLLLTSFLVLNTINPQLTSLERPEIEFGPLFPDYPVFFPDDELAKPKPCEAVKTYSNEVCREGTGTSLNIGMCTNVTSPQSIKAVKGDCNIINFYSSAGCDAYSTKGMSISLVQDSCLSISSYNAGDPIRSIRIGENVSYEVACDNDCTRCRNEIECADSMLGSCCWYNNACSECTSGELDCDDICGACDDFFECEYSRARCQWNSITNQCIIDITK